MASDRSGVAADKENYVSLVKEMQEAFAEYDFDLTVTLPCSYWYMQNFDIVSMEKYLSWFNVMSYDMNGAWNAESAYIGPYIYGLTNLTEIEAGFDLLWRNNIDPANVVMGMAFYGRTYTMETDDCYEIGCEFATTGSAGQCSTTAGILMYSGKAVTQNSLQVGSEITLTPGLQSYWESTRPGKSTSPSFW